MLLSESIGIRRESLLDQLMQQLVDPVRYDWMDDAVTFTRCGHTLSERTAQACLERRLPCPIGEPHEASPYITNLITRKLIQLFRNADTSSLSLRGRLTSFPLYLGDAGTAIPFIPVGIKTEGCALGTFYSYQEGRQTSQWIGKVGEATGLLRNDPRSIRTRVRSDMNLDTIKEKIACDCYAILGMGCYDSPRTCLSRQPIIDRFTTDHLLAQDRVELGIQESLRIMSRMFEGYHDFAQAYTELQGERILLIEYIRREHRPPEQLYTPEGIIVPLTGLIELIAAGRIIGDTDLLGGTGKNAGFVWIKNDRGVTTSARTVKIDPGYAFQILLTEGERSSRNALYNTLHRLGHHERWLDDPRDTQIANNDLEVNILWKDLAQAQRNRLVTVLATSLKILTAEDIRFIFFRDGAFQRTRDEQIPPTIAELYATKMEEWLVHQQRIYREELAGHQAAIVQDPVQSFHDLMLEKERLLQSIQGTLQASQREIAAERLAREQMAISEQRARAEAEIQLQAKRESQIEAEASRVENERLRQQLLEAENALSQVLAVSRDIPGSPQPASSKEAAAPSQKEGRNTSPIVSKGGKAPIIQKGQFEGLETYAFGKAKWETYFGDIGEEPPLPPDIHEILAGRCPFDSKKTVRETHMLVLVPATVGGVPLTLNLLGELLKKPKGGGRVTQYHDDVWQAIFDQYGAVPCQESHWVLMSRDVLPGTRSKSFRDQCAILAGFGDFRVPTLLEAAVCIFMEHVATGNRLYGDNPWTYTRCVEECKGYQTGIGGFGAGGLHVSSVRYGDECSGLALLWKFRH